MNLEPALEEIEASCAALVEVVIDAAWGWYWAADVVERTGCGMHLAHPLGIEGFENRRVKNDDRDAFLFADLLRLGRLPAAWVAPPEIRELRELVRYRRKLSWLQAGLKAQVHQTLGKERAILPMTSIWYSGGQRWLDELQVADAYTNRVESLRDLLEVHHREIATAIQAIGGVGRVLVGMQGSSRPDRELLDGLFSSEWGAAGSDRGRSGGVAGPVAAPGVA